MSDFDRLPLQADLPKTRGCYLLGLELRRAGALKIGRLGSIMFAPGIYFYVGSARGPGGLRGRLGRHLHGARRSHWHIDYLRRMAEPIALVLYPGDDWQECTLSAALDANPLFSAVPAFGCTDCRCETHLYHTDCPVKTIASSLPSSRLIFVAKR